MSTENIEAFGKVHNKVGVEKNIKVNSASDKGCPVFGIDLGTTNSAISIVASGTKPTPIKLKTGKYTMPSCVMLKNGELIAGEEAYSHRDEECSVYSVKTLMGDVNAKVTMREANGNEVTMTPAEVSAEILKGLVEQTDGFYGEVKDVVVTVPAYFDQNSIDATRKACELAGLNLIEIANEPTAAALCYDLAPKDGGKKTIMIYDLGGGTFDVTVATITNNAQVNEMAKLYGLDDFDEDEDDKVISCIAIDGNTHLGGDDIDKELLKIMFRMLRNQGINPHKFTEVYKENMLLRAEQMKKAGVLSCYDFNISTVDTEGATVETSIHISPKEFEEAARVVFDKTRAIVNRVLRKVQHIDSMVLVGGSTKHPMIRGMLSKFYPNLVIEDAVDPDLNVSEGAAIQGHLSKFGDGSTKIFDILPISIGVVSGGELYHLIKKDTQLPAVATYSATTAYDGQQEVEVKVMQGNSSIVEEGISLGSLILEVEPAPAGTPDLQITLSVSADRKMKCVANLDGKIKELHLQLSGDTNHIQLAKEERLLQRWRNTANSMAPEDRDVLLSMIDAYPSIDRKQIMTFIREHRTEEFVDMQRCKFDADTEGMEV